MRASFTSKTYHRTGDEAPWLVRKIPERLLGMGETSSRGPSVAVQFDLATHRCGQSVTGESPANTGARTRRIGAPASWQPWGMLG